MEQLKNVGLDVPQVTELAWLLLQDSYCLPDDIIFREECVRPLKKNCWRNAMSVIKTEHLTPPIHREPATRQAAVSDVTFGNRAGGDDWGHWPYRVEANPTLIPAFQRTFAPHPGKF